MASPKNIPNPAASTAFGPLPTLRDRAIERFQTMAHQDMETITPEETKQLVHELRVHQIELEIQNEDLRRVQEELDAARARYFDLYDFAPVGYVSVSEKGLILRANLTAATLLGVTRSALIKQPLSKFILSEDLDIYYQLREKLYALHLERSEPDTEPRACELRMVKDDDETMFWACMEASVRKNIDDKRVFRAVLSNITKLKLAEEALQKALLDEIKTLRGIIPICANCKMIRDDEGFWSQVEDYVGSHTEAVFSHGLCPDCVNKLFPELRFNFGRSQKKDRNPP